MVTLTPKAVDFTTLLGMAGEKLIADRDTLTRLLMDDDGIRDIAEQDRLMAEIQAGMRLIDVMHGHLDIGGNYIETGKPQPAADAPKGLPKVDFDKLQAALTNKDEPQAIRSEHEGV